MRLANSSAGSSDGERGDVALRAPCAAAPVTMPAAQMAVRNGWRDAEDRVQRVLAAMHETGELERRRQ